MKFGKIEKICKSRKRIFIYNDPASGAQWLGDSCGIYLLEGMPHISSADELLRLFDVPESKHVDYHCKFDNLPEEIDFSDEIGAQDEGLEPNPLTIGWKDSRYALFKDGPELYAINTDYLEPFVGDSDYIRYHRRELKGAGGGFVLGINMGLQLQAVICPDMIYRQEKFTKGITEVAEACLYMQRHFPKPEILPAETVSGNPEQQKLEE
ncbi:MAG: hypothetical protein FWC70_05595 [Defluviitaleaceae bacterium]|nr:hypothetical protein [Defluviitaleaceae bacterium]